jgi:hypothetical protein
MLVQTFTFPFLRIWPNFEHFCISDNVLFECIRTDVADFWLQINLLALSGKVYTTLFCSNLFQYCHFLKKMMMTIISSIRMFFQTWNIEIFHQEIGWDFAFFPFFVDSIIELIKSFSWQSRKNVFPWIICCRFYGSITMTFSVELFFRKVFIRKLK